MVTIASSELNGDIFTVSLQEVANAAWQAFTGNLSFLSLTDFVNRAIIDAEASQPEGTKMEMVISGWVNPITGTDYSGDVAGWLNTQWLNGSIKGESGRAIIPWAEYPDQIAWADQNQVTLRWTKWQIGGPFLVLYIAAGLIALAIILNWIGNFLKPWRMGAQPPSGGIGGTSQSTLVTWWNGLSLGGKTLVIAGASAAVLFGVWYLAEKSIAEAGATKQTFIISGGET